jgi:ABC-type transport system involved in multi-copper enzyme maturation permease subunit
MFILRPWQATTAGGGLKMQFKAIFLFELRYQLRRPYTWLFFGVLLLIAFLLTRDSSLEDALYHTLFINSPYLIVKTEAVAGMLWLVIAAAVAGDAAARDVQTRMHALVYTTGIHTRSYLFGKFWAALSINLFILLSIPIGGLLGVYLPGMQQEVLGPFRPAAYITSFAFFTIPNAFFATAIQFSIALRSGRPMAAYLGSLMLVFMSYFMATLVRFYLFREQGMLLDPLGVHFILENLGADWTAYEKKWRLLGLEGIVLENRLFWMGLGALVLFITSLRFRFVHRAGKERKVRRYDDGEPETAKSNSSQKASDIPLPSVRQSFGWAFSWRQTVAIALSSFGTLVKSRTGLALLIFIPLFTMLIIIDQMQALGTPLAPVTVRVLKELTTPLTNALSRWAIVPLLTIFFAGELVWRERDNGMDDITGAMPCSNWAQFGGKYLGLCLMLTLFLVCLLVVGVGAQLILGYQFLEIGLYVKILFGLQLPEYLLFALLAIVVHAIVNHKYLGYLANLLIYAFIAALAGMLGIEHGLLIYGASPEWSYTTMSGFGVSLAPWLWFKLYWAAFALLLAVIGQQLWVRGREGSLGTRFKDAVGQLTRATVITGVVGLLILTSIGGFILYNLHVRNTYRSTASVKQLKADYERRYGPYAELPQPQIRSTRLQVDIYPAASRVAVKGSNLLVNLTQKPIVDIHLTEATIGVTLRKIYFDRQVRLILNDLQQGYRIYKLKNSLQPGDSLKLAFEVQVQRQGFTNQGADPSITPHSSVLESNAWCPAIGYQPSRELMNASDRRDANLPSRPAVPALDDPAQSAAIARNLKTNFEAVVSTVRDQVAIAPGALRASWYKGDRRYFHYVASAPIPNSFAFFSGKYAVHTEEFNKVQVRIFHYPRHTGNLKRIMESIGASLAYNIKQYGPYPYTHLSVFEHPQAPGSSLHSEPGMIWYGQAYPFWQPKEAKDLDQPYAVMAHEMGHQFQVDYAFAEGAPLLSESFAWYSAMQVFRESRGEAQLELLRAFMREPFPYPPIKRGEPLLRAVDPYLAYRKGPFALYALGEYIGVEQVNTAFRRTKERSKKPGAALTKTIDLYRELKLVTPDSLQYLLHDLFEVNTYWKFKIERASARAIGKGRWEVTVDLNSEKTVYNERGEKQTVPMNDWVELGLFADQGGSKGQIYLGKHRLRSGSQRLTLISKTKPGYVSVDPRLLLIYTRNRDPSGMVQVK